MPNRYYSNTALPTTLSGGVTNSATSMPVTATTGFPTSYPYTLVVDESTASEELVSVTAGAGTSLTVSRGQDGTAAVSHSAGAAVRHVISARDLREPQDHIAETTAAHGVTFANLVTLAGTQTLTSKTLSTPAIVSPTMTGTVTGAVTFSTPSGVARGTLGYAQVTASQGGITTNVDLTGLTVTVTVGTGRRIKIVAYSPSVGSGVASDLILMRIQEGSTTLQYATAPGAGTGLGTAMTAMAILTPSAGAHTYKVTAERNTGSGSVQVNASTTSPAFILVEDIGA